MNPTSSSPTASAAAHAVPEGRPLVTPRVLTLVFPVALFGFCTRSVLSAGASRSPFQESIL